MVKHAYIIFYIGDWLKDPQLSFCSPATRGVWIDLLCRIHELGQGGKITANAQQLARLCRSSDADINAALQELQTTGAAEVYERDGVYTVVCRRMKKAAELSAKRQQAGSKGGSKREATPFDLLVQPPSPSSPPHTPPLTPTPSTSVHKADALEKVREFAKKEGINQGDADWFFYKGEGNGWKNGGEPIRDWKATLRSWHHGGYLPSQRRKDRNQSIVYDKPKQRAPTYPQMPPKREPTDAEVEKARQIAQEHVEKLKAQFKMPK